MTIGQVSSRVSTPPKTKLLDQVRETIRRKHYSIRTETTYIDWIKRYILFHRKRPAEMGGHEMEQFLNHLAVDKEVAASTQNQALSALVFLYREVLRKDFEWMDNLESVRMESRFGKCLRRAARERIELQNDPGVARETRLPQAILGHAFSVKMRGCRAGDPGLAAALQICCSAACLERERNERSLIFN
jgi:hypothetical protein